MINAKRRKVIDAFMKGMNKKEAMLEAGYAMTMATTRANDVFGDKAVQAEIQRRQNLASHRSDVTMDWLVQRLKSIAAADLGDMLDVYSDGSAKINLEKLTPDMRVAISKFSADSYTEGRGKNSQEVKRVKVDFADKLKAIEMLIRHLGFSKEKASLELSGELTLTEALHAGRQRAGLEEDNE